MNNWQHIDGMTWVSFSHWGMFCIGPAPKEQQ